MNYYTCSNRDPDRDGPITTSAFVYLDTISIILHVFIKLRINLYQKRKASNIEPKHKIWMTKNSLIMSKIEVASIADFTTNVIGISIITAYAMLAKHINAMTVLELNTWPNYILMNFYQFIIPSITAIIISTLYYSRHPLLRKTLVRELKNCLSLGHSIFPN